MDIPPGELPICIIPITGFPAKFIGAIIINVSFVLFFGSLSDSEAEPLLENGTSDEYRRFLELYIELDQDLALKLAQRAANHEDPDIREAGEDFLKKVKIRS